VAVSSKVRVIPLAVVLVLALAASSDLIAVTPSEARSLRGLSGVEVVIETLPDELRSAGLNADQLQADVQSHLRANQIRVLTSEDTAPGRPWLYLRLSVLKSSSVPLVSFYVGAQLRQDVTLERNPDFHLAATTWDAGAAGLAGTSALADAVRETVQSLAERFASEFQAVNPGR